MKARDVMTREVATVAPDTPAGAIARLLLDRQISAVPVVDAGGAPIGMVSEGDLIGRDAAARASRRDWWLALLAEGTELSADFIKSLRRPQRTAREVMSAPVVTIEEDADAGEIARLLAEYRIKRVPVIRDGRLVGIVSRADLLRALAAEQVETHPSASASAAPAHGLLGGLSDWVEQVEEHFRHDRGAAGAPAGRSRGRRQRQRLPRPGGGFRASRGRARGRSPAQRRAAAPATGGGADRPARLGRELARSPASGQAGGRARPHRMAAAALPEPAARGRRARRQRAAAGLAENPARRGRRTLSAVGARTEAAGLRAVGPHPRLPRRHAGRCRPLPRLGRMKASWRRPEACSPRATLRGRG